MSQNTPNHYDTLGVPHFSSTEVCKQAWKTKSFSQHPDLFGDDKVKVRQTEIVKVLNAAWYVLGDTHRKAAYDAQLHQEMSTQTETAQPQKWTFGRIFFAVLATIAVLRVCVWVVKTVFFENGLL